MTINELIKESHETAVEKGWWKTERNFPEQLMLMVSELAEVLEEYRKTGLDQVRMIWIDDKEKPDGIAVEFADLLIRVADTCGKYDIPLNKALELKLNYNKIRPYRHGNKKA